MRVFWAPKPLKYKFLGVTQPRGVAQPYILEDTTRPRHITCSSLVEIGSKTAEKNSAQTDRQTDTMKIMVTWPWTKKALETARSGRGGSALTRDNCRCKTYRNMLFLYVLHLQLSHVKQLKRNLDFWTWWVKPKPSHNNIAYFLTTMPNVYVNHACQ